MTFLGHYGETLDHEIKSILISINPRTIDPIFKVIQKWTIPMLTSPGGHFLQDNRYTEDIISCKNWLYIYILQRTSSLINLINCSINWCSEIYKSYLSFYIIHQKIWWLVTCNAKIAKYIYASRIFSMRQYLQIQEAKRRQKTFYLLFFLYGSLHYYSTTTLI